MSVLIPKKIVEEIVAGKQILDLAKIRANEEKARNAKK